jgi:phage host-nuclease inhibitor protein Gam
MNTNYETFKKNNRLKLFGHEDAGKEDASRLTSYYYKTIQYEDVISDIKLQIVTGEKGTGKSALLKMAFIETADTDVVPIWIRLDDLSELYSEILNSENLYQLKTLWKRSISKLVIISLASHMSFAMSEDYEKALQWAYDTGYSTRDFISRSAKILKPMYDKYISLDNEADSCGEHHTLQRMIANKKIRLFFDDFDLDWQGKSSDILKIKSLLLSLSDITSDMDGLSVRIALRTDVYEMIRNEEFSDKFESSLIKCQWNNQEIMKTLAKRICAYFDVPFDEITTSDPKTLQYNIVKYLNFIFVPYFDESTRVWAKAPTHRVIYSLIRRKPRDMVKLCHSIAEEAYRKKLTIIDSSCFLAILETYSQERLKDLVNEYVNQLPKLQDLLIRMAPTQKEFQSKTVERYVYSTAELHNKIKNIQQNMNISIFQANRENLCPADFHQIAHFLYKIGFITGRKRNESGKIDRVYYDEAKYLLNANVGDRGYSWEIHPAYRGALAIGTNDNWEATLNMEDEV